MRLSAFFYVLKQGVKNIFRHKLFSLASVATMITCIFLFGTIYAMVTNVNHMVMTAEESVGITVFFNEGLSEKEIQKIGEEIQAIDAVSEIHFVSAQEAWEDYKSRYFAENENLSEGFEEDNPLANSANYQVMLSDVSQQAKVTEQIGNIIGVRRVNSSQDLANTLTGVNSLLMYMSIAVIGLLLVVSVFLISNTISMGVAVRSEEIAIMKLMGAKNSFVRAPFLIEGMLLGAVGAIVPLAVLYLLYGKVIAIVLHRYSILSNLLQFLPVNQVFRSLAPLSLIMGIFVGFAGSFISIRRHLKV